MSQFNPELFRTYIAPGMDQPVQVTLPGLEEEFSASRAWMQQYMLSSVFQGEFTGLSKPYAESILARTQMTFSAYEVGRNKLIDYAENWSLGQPGVARYLMAISEWEKVFLNLQILFSLYAKFWGMTFTEGGSEYRIRAVANRIKHIDEDIESGKKGALGMPMWIETDCFATIKAKVSFEEISKEVRLLAKFADCLSMPSEAKARFEALREELSNDPDFQIRP